MKKYIINNLNTEFIGKRIDYYETIDSTHLFAKRLKDNEIENGMIILADNQTAGIGTHERKWFTDQGKNLSFNIVLVPKCMIDRITKLTIMTADCLVSVLKEFYKIDVKIKEPNDIILNGKKMAGILTESIAQGKKIKKIYIGIGININQTEFPGSLENIATSLKKEFNKDFDRDEILAKFLEKFEKEYIKMIEE